jgi:heteromeric Ino2p/Ino4p transcription factor
MSQEEDINESLTPESSDSDHSPNASSRRKKKESKPRLTAVQKNTNHKDAENKRRNAIRERFTDLSAMVPGTQGQERSEQVMLQKTAEFLKRQMEELRQLEAMADQKGVVVDDKDKLKDNDYGGKEWKQPHMDEYRQQKAKKAASGVQVAKEEDE